MIQKLKKFFRDIYYPKYPLWVDPSKLNSENRGIDWIAIGLTFLLLEGLIPLLCYLWMKPWSY